MDIALTVIFILAAITFVLFVILQLKNAIQYNNLLRVWEEKYGDWVFVTATVKALTDTCYVCEHTYDFKQTIIEIPFEKLYDSYKKEQHILLALNPKNTNEYFVDINRTQAEFFETNTKNAAIMAFILFAGLSATGFILLFINSIP